MAVSYMLQLLRPDGSEAGRVLLLPETDENGVISYTFEDLEPSTEYTLNLTIYDEEGNTINLGSIVGETSSML